MSRVNMERLSEQPQSNSSQPSYSDSDHSVAGSHILVSVVMPCLNEARTLAACIEQAHSGCQAALAIRQQAPLALYSGRGAGGEGPSAACTVTRPTYEIIIADNGSSDGSPEIAAEHGARVVVVEQKGYGAALRGGIAAARGKYVVMGDSDCSYDFGEVPRFIEKLEEGYDLVMGNRFAGEIKPGAMPWHHRYIGNPVLSGIGRLLYRTPCRDWHCGLRAFEREKIQKLGLKCTGMEFASEVVVHATQERLRIAEMPVILHPDGRSRAPHLRSMRDGFRHLWLILTCFSRKFFAFLAIVVVLTLAGSLALLSIGFGGEILHVENPIRLSENLEVGRRYQISVSIRNSSSNSVDLIGAMSTCSCLLVEKSVIAIPPNSSIESPVEIRPTTVGSYIEVITVFVRSTRQPKVVLEFMGNVSPRRM